MIAASEAERIARGLVEEYSLSLSEDTDDSGSSYFLELDGLVYHDPLSALAVLESAANQIPNDWTYECLAAGPVRTFLYLYADNHPAELTIAAERTLAFGALVAQAREGMTAL